MDALIAEAAEALARGDVLTALKRIGIREDPISLALRGIAMARLGDFDRARLLLRQSAQAFGPGEPLAQARCVVAEAEIALVERDLGWSPKALEAALKILISHGDRLNEAQARHIAARRLLLIGRLDEAERQLADQTVADLPAAWRAAHELVVSQLAARRLLATAAFAALSRAEYAASLSGIEALKAEIGAAKVSMMAPVAHLQMDRERRLLRLEEVEALFASGLFVVDACRRSIRTSGTNALGLASRPVLFALVRELALAWPDDVPRDVLVAKAFGGRSADESHRARLRVEIARLRRELRAIAEIRATRRGFVLTPRQSSAVAVLEPIIEERHPALLALLADGESWSTSSLALALGTSARTVQRDLRFLEEAGTVRSFGSGRARRWVRTTALEFPTTLLLPFGTSKG